MKIKSKINICSIQIGDEFDISEMNQNVIAKDGLTYELTPDQFEFVENNKEENTSDIIGTIVMMPIAFFMLIIFLSILMTICGWIYGLYNWFIN